jgi:spore maturation protein CgeB
MRVVMFYHSLVSDWNHGNAHFLRGVAAELIARGHDVRICEPAGNWSRSNLEREFGDTPVREFRSLFPQFDSRDYSLDTLDLDCELDGADLVLVHEWNDHSLVERIGRHHVQSGSYRLLFHDTHHRCVTDPTSMSAYQLDGYDGVLAFGECIREIYERQGWARRAWTWHEAADTRVFRPWPETEKAGDLVWVGNWGDDERTAELHEFVLTPVRELHLSASAFGVRYPDDAVAALAVAGIDYGGWLPNYRVPETFSRYRVTVHVPRRPYVHALPGIPTIRPFEAMACGIPLVSAPWHDTEGLFQAGEDYLIAKTGVEMKRHLKALIDEPDMAQEIARSGLRRILSRHTCRHRVDELLDICQKITPAREELATTGIA